MTDSLPQLILYYITDGQVLVLCDSKQNHEQAVTQANDKNSQTIQDKEM